MSQSEPQMEPVAPERAVHEREALLHALADEHAALRRVATLVAAEAPERELFDSVAREIGLLFGADLASLVRYDGKQVEIVAGYSRSPAAAVPTGLVLDVDRATATKKALHTGRPARADNAELTAPGAAPLLGNLGIQSAVAAPIQVAGGIWGAVTAARTSAASFAEGAELRLGDFAELVAQAIANAQARRELAASSARIVAAGDAERRRIERNLHDGAQQRLVTLALSLRLARARLAHHPEASDVLERASEEVALTLDELQALARGIHPVVLTDHGLLPALGALADRTPLPVTVVAQPTMLPRLGEAVETTAYYVVAEGLTNVAKYARATSARVSVTVAPDTVCVEVTDDGIGGADVGGGSGLRGLVDRVEALQGTLRIESRPGAGTRVSATIPIAVPREE